MINQFKNLSEEEKALLLKAPVLVSVLASSSFGELNQTQKKDAIKLAHLKTFTADPLLLPYYHEVEKGFTSEFEEAVIKYFPFDDSKRYALKKEIDRVQQILAKLDPAYAKKLNKSLHGYADHVKRSTHSVFQDFLIPLHIQGWND